MINSGMAGLNLGLVFHEVEREIRYINEDIKRGSDLHEVSVKITNIMQLLDGFAPILRQQNRSAENISAIFQRVYKLTKSRFKYHRIVFSSPLLSKESEDFQLVGQSNLLVSAINNLIDNSIYWTRIKREKEENSEYIPYIYVSTNTTEFNGPALIIGDNGDGFKLPPEDLTRPFVTTKPGGMGLGLYYASLVMEMYGGKLLFIDPRDYDIPSTVTGAVLALEFKKEH